MSAFSKESSGKFIRWVPVPFMMIALLVAITVALPNHTYADESTALEISRILHINYNLPRSTHAVDLKNFGDDTLADLSTFLTNVVIGDQAASVMIELDYQRAGPMIFASMPKSDRGVQRHTFQSFIRLINQGMKVDCMQDMHDAAVRCLEADTNADAGVQAIYAIGLTGSESDFVHLEKLYNNTHPVPSWRTKLRDAAEAALARLGHRTYILNIKNQLSRPIPDPFMRKDAFSLVASIQKAEFTRNPEFVPLLRAHLKTPGPVRRTDNLVYPAYSAGKALDSILGKSWRTENATSEQVRESD